MSLGGTFERESGLIYDESEIIQWKCMCVFLEEIVIVFVYMQNTTTLQIVALSFAV